MRQGSSPRLYAAPKAWFVAQYVDTSAERVAHKHEHICLVALSLFSFIVRGMSPPIAIKPRHRHRHQNHTPTPASPNHPNSQPRHQHRHPVSPTYPNPCLKPTCCVLPSFDSEPLLARSRESDCRRSSRPWLYSRVRSVSLLWPPQSRFRSRCRSSSRSRCRSSSRCLLRLSCNLHMQQGNRGRL